MFPSRESRVTERTHEIPVLVVVFSVRPDPTPPVDVLAGSVDRVWVLSVETRRRDHLEAPQQREDDCLHLR